MKYSILNCLPTDKKLKGFIARGPCGHVFYWQEMFPGKEEEIKKKLELASGKEVINFCGTKQELQEKIRELDHQEGFSG